MTALRASAFRQAVAAALILLTMLAGVGRTWAADVESGGAVALMPGVSAPICHSGGGSGPQPVDGTRHDCCDVCTLCAAIDLPGSPTLTAPPSVARFAEHAVALPWAPVVSRPRTPRLSQGPPAA